MKVSVVIAVYKDIESLRVIINALEIQTYKNFDVIIAEDGQDDNMRKYVQSITALEVKHTTQEDIGLRKARSQNNGVLASSGEYLIFIDGDCIPYSTFIQRHVELAESGCVLSGRRVNIPIDMAKKIKNGTLNPLEIEKNLLRYWYLFFNREARYKQGIELSTSSLFYKIISLRNPTATLLGCNFSCYKKDMIEINGFDESYGESSLSDDVDLEWRFQAYGLRLKSCKNVANMFHLDHKVYERDNSKDIALMLQRKRDNVFKCEMGLNTHI